MTKRRFTLARQLELQALFHAATLNMNAATKRVLDLAADIVIEMNFSGPP